VKTVSSALIQSINAVSPGLPTRGQTAVRYVVPFAATHRHFVWMTFRPRRGFSLGLKVWSEKIDLGSETPAAFGAKHTEISAMVTTKAPPE
jgi:hypothetical protein